VAGERGWAEEEERKGKGRGMEGEVEGREREGPQVTVEPGPLRALLHHWAPPMESESFVWSSFTTSWQGFV